MASGVRLLYLCSVVICVLCSITVSSEANFISLCEKNCANFCDSVEFDFDSFVFEVPSKFVFDFVIKSNIKVSYYTAETISLSTNWRHADTQKVQCRPNRFVTDNWLQDLTLILTFFIASKPLPAPLIAAIAQLNS